MEQIVCPLSMASEQPKQCLMSCKFYDVITGKCMLVKAVEALAKKS